MTTMMNILSQACSADVRCPSKRGNATDGWWGTNDLSARLVDGKVFDPGSDWHTYRALRRKRMLSRSMSMALFLVG